MALLITFVLGLFFLIGVVVIKFFSRRPFVEHIEQLSIALALGAMMALAMLDLLPEVMEAYQGKSLLIAFILVLAGVLLLVVLDRFIPEHADDMSEEEESEGEMLHIGIIATVAIVLHNILEGMTVYSMAGQSVSTGISMAIGVGLHNIPMGMMIYSTVVKEPKAKKHFIVYLATFSTFVGGLMMALISGFLSQTLTSALVCIALGMVLYIIIFELFPYVLRHKKRKLNAIAVVVGMLVVVLSMCFA